MKKILLGSVVALFIFAGCNESTEETQKVQKVEKSTEQTTRENDTNKNIEIIKTKSNEIIDSSKEIVKAVKEETLKAVDDSKDATKDAIAKAKEVSVDVVKQANKVAKDISKSIDKVIANEDEIDERIKGLYVKCAGCHGKNGELHALGKSQKIGFWDEKKIEDSLLGYKNGTYGGDMKGIMKGQVMQLSETDIKALSKYISKIGK
ncbi:c-type cytochrome [Arcobacter sp.]|uniref:c-type cytochrome n=1 Tax=unclassified Arcobacter TaxID=2593671 RepID=UPI003AFF7DD8